MTDLGISPSGGERIFTTYLEYAEGQARRRQVLYMRGWRERLDAFLQFDESEILANPGKVITEVADRLALQEYDQFNACRLTSEAQTDERAFEIAVKKLSVAPPCKKSSKPKKQRKI
ncbi:MAG: RhuM family protein [Ilumatobacteraceae bacterium]